MNDYYEGELLKLRFAIDDLKRVNWNGLHHWLSAKATWTLPPMTPEYLAELREHAKALCEAGVP